jgi:uncharacterized protein (TIGR02099 family)
MPVTSSTSFVGRRVLRGVAMSALLLLGAFFALLLAVRLVVLPQLEMRHADIAQWLSTRIGQPVEIDGVITGWDGWNPRLSIRGFRIRSRTAGEGTLLELPRVDMLVAWTSLPLLDLRLKALLIEGPRLSLRRDPAGRLHIAGIERDAEPEVDDSAFADWLMRQPQIIVRDALVAWNDDYRRAPQLLLDHVTLRLEQRFGHHLAGLTGVPPQELAAPLELRADVSGHALNDWANLEGRVYVRLDYADVAAWHEWLPLPVPIESGKGAMRVWIDFARSRPVAVTADLELEDVRATLGETLAPLELSHIAGRAEWKQSGARTEFAAKALTFALPDGASLPPADFTLVIGNDPATGGALAFKALELRPWAAVAPHLPFPDGVRRDIARFDPRGSLHDGAFEWTGSIETPARYAAKAEFRNVAFAAHDAVPGAANLSGTLEANERGGQVRLASQAATLTLPRLFAEPLMFETLRAEIGWQRSGDATQLQLKEAAFANPDVSGTAAGTWRSRSGSPGDIDVRAQLTRANLASVHRYLPLGAGQGVREWLRRALTRGTSADAKLALAGDLAQFPFAAGRGGQFVIAAKAQDATLVYADGWPAISDIAADVRLENTRLSIKASTGRVLNAQIGATRAEIADFHDAHPVLHVDGTASGPTTEFLAFVAQSPVDAWSGHVTQDATVSGDGRLALALDLPLRDPAAVKVDGKYEFLSNAIRWAAAPPLTGVTGTLAFTERDQRATDLVAEAFGGPLELQVASEEGRVRIRGAGSVDPQRVRKDYDVPLLDRVSGRTDWQMTADVRGTQVAWTVESSLQGAAIDLPAPFHKPASEKAALRIERQELRAQEDRISIGYGPLAHAVLHRQLGAQGATVDRALILLGKAATDTAEPDQPGIWVRGDVAALDLGEWLALDSRGAPASRAPEALPLNGVDLAVGTLSALGRTFTRLKSTARRQGSDWRLTLDANELAGTAVWRTPTSAQPSGRIVARLARLSTPSSADAGASPASPTTAATAANRWPEVDIVADAMRSKERTLGRLELLAHPAGNDWQIQKLALSNDAGRIDASGVWRNIASRSETSLDVAVDVKDAGEFLGRFGWPNAVRGAATKIDGQLSWAGAPSDFDYPSLSGAFRLRSGSGQFTKVDPGVGRLLGVLSLQALPRRISLDFRDVFSEGFAFDAITADVRMRNGVMHTDDFRLVGPAAAVNIAGDVDVARETQQLKVRVQPSLSSGVSVGTAALFIANPLVGAAVGAGTLLAQKMLNNPFDQLFSYEYAVTGSWDDPVVTRAGAGASAAAQSGAAIR